jgi:hypothetical protein
MRVTEGTQVLGEEPVDRFAAIAHLLAPISLSDVIIRRNDIRE